MKFKLSCTDFTFPLLSHDHVLDLIAMLGVAGVDIGLFAAATRNRPTDVTKNTAKSARELSLRVCDRGLSIADVFLFPGRDFNSLSANHPQASARKRSRDLFLRVLEFSALLKAPHLTTLPGVRWPGESLETSLKRSAEELAWRNERATRCNVVFSVEPHYGSITPTPQLTHQLLAMAPGLTLTLDYGHFFYQGIPFARINSLAKYASHVHVRGGARKRMQTPMKDNKINFGQVQRTLERLGYKGYLALEYCWDEWMKCNEADTLSETILLRNLLSKATR